MTLESGLGDLDGLGKVLEAYDELGGENEPELEDLMSPYRRLNGSYECLLREAPFDESGLDEAKTFLMNDILLIGLDTRKVGKDARRKRTGTLDKKEKKGTLEIKRGTLTKFKGNYKLLHYLDLKNCQVKDVGEGHNGFHGLQITHVHRVRERTPNGRKKKGTFKIITKIARLELWLPVKDLADELQGRFYDAIHELEEQDASTNDDAASQASSSGGNGPSRLSLRSSSRGSMASNSTGAGGAPAKHRKWAANRVRRTTLEKSAGAFSSPSVSGRGSNAESGIVTRSSSATSKSGSPHLDRAQSLMSTGESVMGDSVGGGLQLSDLEQRYQLDLSAETDERTEIEVEFGEGKMGLSLGSTAGVGVIVGALAPNGFAELAGVLISDRVAAINDEEVGLDDHWQDVLEKLKQYPRPIKIKFERFAVRTNELIKHNRNMVPAEVAVTGEDSSGRSRAKAKELAKITAKAERVVERGHGLKRVFKAVKEDEETASTANNRALAGVLEEIFLTELAYVNDLKNLVASYVLPLRDFKVKTKCRDIEGGVLCEHNILRSTCPRSSKEHQPVLKADDLKGIFLNVETIMVVNVELLRLLENRISTLTATTDAPPLAKLVKSFAVAFSRVIPFFKLYSEFCHQYAEAVDRLLFLRKDNPKVNDFLKDIERQGANEKNQKKKVQTLSSLLIKPVQRICKYPLLFGELLRHADPSLEGIEELEAAKAMVDKIAAAVNMQVGESKKFEEFMEVYRDLGGESGVPGLVTPSRRYVDQFDVLVKAMPFAKSKANPRTIFVFNDLVIIAKGEAGTLSRTRSLQRVSLSRSASAVSAAAADGPSLGRTISRFFSGIFGGGDEDDDAASRASAKRKTLKRNQRHFKPVHQFDVSRMALGEKTENSLVQEEMYHFVLTAKERIEADGGKGTLGKGRKGTAGKGTGTGKMATHINKYMICADTEEYRDRVYDTIASQIEEFEEREKGTDAGKRNFGKKEAKRNWAKKTNGTLKARVQS
ncbi:RhoGEF domain-containing protein gxcJ [Durusdinium trenchii]|uniref:RhoGEF domain-containing protein gxcJ n=1 Tax=Durusdinium trenchii TaxID=1381693 RepID=A0ABP0J1R6_9DINO